MRVDDAGLFVGILRWLHTVLIQWRRRQRRWKRRPPATMATDTVNTHQLRGSCMRRRTYPSPHLATSFQVESRVQRRTRVSKTPTVAADTTGSDESRESRNMVASHPLTACSTSDDPHQCGGLHRRHENTKTEAAPTNPFRAPSARHIWPGQALLQRRPFMRQGQFEPRACAGGARARLRSTGPVLKTRLGSAPKIDQVHIGSPVAAMLIDPSQEAVYHRALPTSGAAVGFGRACHSGAKADTVAQTKEGLFMSSVLLSSPVCYFCASNACLST